MIEFYLQNQLMRIHKYSKTNYGTDLFVTKGGGSGCCLLEGTHTTVMTAPSVESAVLSGE